MFSSHIGILLKRAGIWVSGGAPVALPSDPAHPLPHGFNFAPKKLGITKKVAKTQLFEIPIHVGMMGCLLGAPI